MRRAEVISPRQIDQLGSQLHFASFKEADVVDLVQEITRLATLHNPVLVGVAFENVAQALFINRNTAHLRRALEYFRERCRRWRLDARPVTHASQKRFVHQISFVKVRGEDDKLFERHFDLLAAVQRKKVDTPFERQDPAIQQIPRRDPLAAKSSMTSVPPFDLTWKGAS